MRDPYSIGTHRLLTYCRDCDQTNRVTPRDTSSLHIGRPSPVAYSRPREGEELFFHRTVYHRSEFRVSGDRREPWFCDTDTGRNICKCQGPIVPVMQKKSRVLGQEGVFFRAMDLGE